MVSPISPENIPHANIVELTAICDWYDAAFVGECPFGVAHALADLLGATVAEADPNRRTGYGRSLRVVDTTEAVGGTRALVHFDHPASPGRVLLSANGPTGQVARSFLLAEGIEHQVNRYDSAVDLSMSDAVFKRRCGRVARYAASVQPPKPVVPQGTLESGYTLYVNRREKHPTDSPHKGLPEAQVVLYDKAKERGLPGDWKRLEMKLRPQKEDGKTAAAKLEPLEVWHAFRWTAEVLRIGAARGAGVHGVEYPRFRMSLPEVEAAMLEIRAMSALKHMMQQYRGQIDVLVEKHGPEYAWGLLRGLYEGSHGEGEQSAREAFVALHEDGGRPRKIN